MTYYDVVKLGSVTKTTMIGKMPCSYTTLRTTAVRIQHQVLQSCTEVSAAFEVSCRPVQRSQLLHNVNILQVKYWSILNVPP